MVLMPIRQITLRTLSNLIFQWLVGKYCSSGVGEEWEEIFFYFSEK